MSVFTNDKKVQKAKQLQSLNLYPFFRPIEDSEGTCVQIDSKKMVMIGSNNYLGLTHHPYVKEQSIKAIEKYGTGCTGSRFLNGNLALHEELEERLARFVGHEEALVFSTGMQSNLGAISALCGPRDCLINDQENHASILDASRLSFGASYKYKHNDMGNLEKTLEMHRAKYEQAFIVADGVFSMTGDIANVPEMVRIAKKYNAFLYIDDAHGLGVLGRSGRGTADHFNLTHEVDFMMGTFSKSFASIGGFVSGSKEAINYVKYNARSFMFSASMPPAAVATVLACLDLVEKDESIVKKLWENVHFVKKGFDDLGFYTYNSETCIIPIFIGDDLHAMKATMKLHDRGVFATPVISPAVPTGEALIRTSYMSTHSRQELQYVLDVFADLAKEFDFKKEKFKEKVELDKVNQ